MNSAQNLPSQFGQAAEANTSSKKKSKLEAIIKGFFDDEAEASDSDDSVVELLPGEQLDGEKNLIPADGIRFIYPDEEADSSGSESEEEIDLIEFKEDWDEQVVSAAYTVPTKNRVTTARPETVYIDDETGLLMRSKFDEYTDNRDARAEQDIGVQWRIVNSDHPELTPAQVKAKEKARLWGARQKQVKARQAARELERIMNVRRAESEAIKRMFLPKTKRAGYGKGGKGRAGKSTMSHNGPFLKRHMKLIYSNWTGVPI